MSLLADLRAIVGDDNASDAAAHRDHHSRDQSPYPAVLPEVVVWVENTEHVSRVAHYANEQRIPLVGWGAGTSIEGNPIPQQGGIVMNFSRMNRIVEVHAADFQVTVEPGLLYKDMNEQLARYGLFFPPDPGANASIGGMVANNAAGTRTVKYGATRDNVLALQVVLADGTVVNTGSRSLKQSAGYDLTHLFTGSEGTLGLITRATLRLYPVLEHVSAATAAFASVQAAAEAVYGIMGSGLVPAALELLDEPTIAALKARAALDVPQATNLFMEFTGASESTLHTMLTLAEDICHEAGCTHFSAGLGRDAHRKLWETRHRTFEILTQQHAGMDWLVTDVAVPISQYAAIATLAADTIAAFGLPGGIVGHAGDGNLHTVVFFAPDDDAGRANANTLNERLVQKALALGGTCTGEHGVGIGKQKYMLAEHGAPAMALMQRLKQTLDPHGILNPGKVITTTSESSGT